MEPALSIIGLRKSYGTAEVLKGIDLEVAVGQVHALLGPNGAGKSTIVKILAAKAPFNEGAVTVRTAGGAALDVRTVGGQSMMRVIHQDLSLVDALTVRENLMLVDAPTGRLGGIRARRERAEARRLLAGVGLDTDPDAPLSSLGLGEKSLVAVARMLRGGEQAIFVLDEVTAALSRADEEFVLDRMRTLASSGASVLVVTHRLKEVATYCDWVTLIEDGAVTYSAKTPELADIERLFISTMHEHRLDSHHAVTSDEPLLSLRAASCGIVGPVNLELHAGEVMALVGALSSKPYLIAHMAAGVLRLSGGSRKLRATPGNERHARTAFIPEDRMMAGILHQLDVASNITISSLSRVSRYGWISRRRELRILQEPEVSGLAIKPSSPTAIINSLSGGNQQKALMARAARMRPDLYVLCEPTRGVDIRARQAIHKFIRTVSSEGAGVLVVTVDPEEALAVADRIGTVDPQGGVSNVRDAAEVDLAGLLEVTS